MFVCDICGKVFSLESEAEEHKASHYGLSAERMREWRRLRKQCVEAGRKVNVCKNSDTDRAFDEAVKELCDFEEKHNL